MSKALAMMALALAHTVSSDVNNFQSVRGIRREKEVDSLKVQADKMAAAELKRQRKASKLKCTN